MKILILCTGNSCRSQMAHGFLQSLSTASQKPDFLCFLMVCSAGTSPAHHVSRNAIKVMNEEGIDISEHTPKNVDIYLNQQWDYVITVCDHANETCPTFLGKVKHRLHMGFEDPAHKIGSEEYVLKEFRRVRDQIKEKFYQLYTEQIKLQL